MAARALVEGDIDQGARLLNALDEAGIQIDVSYWMLSPEWGDWWLVLGTPLYDERPTPSAMHQVVLVQRSLEDTDYLMDKLGVVGLTHRWVRALRKRLSRGLPHPGYRLGSFYAEDLEVEDSYIYRMLMPVRETNGASAKRRTGGDGIGTILKAPAISRLRSEVRTRLSVDETAQGGSPRSSG
jgi:hypothetical protein